MEEMFYAFPKEMRGIEYLVNSYLDLPLLYSITITKPFRNSISEIQNGLKIDCEINKAGLLQLGLHPRTLFYVLRFSSGLAYENRPKHGLFKYDGITVEGYPENPILFKQSEESENDFIKELDKVSNYESALEDKYKIKEQVFSLMKIYKLSPRFIRRLKSIVLYDDYPTNDECLTYWDEFTSKKSAKSKSKKDSKRDEFVDYLVQNKNGFEGLFPEVHKNYITIRIFSDTSLNFLKMPGYRKMLGSLQEQLADFRTTQREKQKNLERDVYLYVLHKILHFGPLEANEALKEYGIEPLVGDPDDIEKTVYNATRVVEERALDIQKSNKSRPSKRQLIFQDLLKQVLATIKSEQK